MAKEKGKEILTGILYLYGDFALVWAEILLICEILGGHPFFLSRNPNRLTPFPLLPTAQRLR